MTLVYLRLEMGRGFKQELAGVLPNVEVTKLRIDRWHIAHLKKQTEEDEDADRREMGHAVTKSLASRGRDSHQ